MGTEDLKFFEQMFDITSDAETEKDLNQHLSAEDCHTGSKKRPTGLFPINVLHGHKAIFKVRTNLHDFNRLGEPPCSQV